VFANKAFTSDRARFLAGIKDILVETLCASPGRIDERVCLGFYEFFFVRITIEVLLGQQVKFDLILSVGYIFYNPHLSRMDRTALNLFRFTIEFERIADNFMLDVDEIFT
jgi:hypothetical protein